MRRLNALMMVALLVFSTIPMSGIGSVKDPNIYLSEIPEVKIYHWEESNWWQTTDRDLNRNGVVDWLETIEDQYPISISYVSEPTEKDIETLINLGLEIRYSINSVNAFLLGYVNSSLYLQLGSLPNVTMIEPYGRVVFYGDVQTPAIKASNSSVYPEGAWSLGVSGKGVNIAVVDTGVDNEHPGLAGKFIAGYDAVCSDDALCMASFQEDDGSFDPDDQNQHGTACSGMAASTGILPNGEPSNFTGSAPDADLVDVRIGTAVGAGPFENYVLEQEFYESAMDGLNWVIENKDTAWPGTENESYGIDIISLSWGITSHENGGSDGSDMFSLVLDEATLAGITVSVAAGNDGSNNDGLSGMGSSSLSITVGATDDKNTVDRSDDGIASYSSRGPRRDNNDGNPYDEMKPDVSAPGTNIVQAEACHASGSCYNRLPGQDAADNGYSGRGSGTSYATPAVSGVIALMIEANPDLDPLAIREILRLTSERKETLTSADGEGVEEGPWATYPELDPYWNRHFGWGMVDAYEAVKSSILNTETENINTDLQTYIINTETGWQTGSNINTITGHSWSRSGSVDRIEYSVDGNSWMEAQYSPGSNDSIYIDWTISLDSKDLYFTGDHVLLVRTVDSNGMYSVSDNSEFYAYGESPESSTNNMLIMLSYSLIGILIVASAVYYRKKIIA
ncbi:MAG: S8 family serine peptidase [archaeon]|nr:S8 family serine peptidase [archaeon]